MCVVILISGWSGAGKDSVGTILQKKWNFKRLAFADELKRVISEEFTIPAAWLETQEGKRKLEPTTGKTVRQLLIQRGQEIRLEKGDPGYFARVVGNQIIQQAHTSTGFVITDWRLPIEISTLESIFASHDIVILKARVYNSTQIESPVKDSTTENQLERYVFDAQIQNDGVSYDALEKEVEKKLYGHIFREE